MSGLRWTITAVKPPGETAVRLTFADFCRSGLRRLISCSTDPTRSSAPHPPGLTATRSSLSAGRSALLGEPPEPARRRASYL